MALPRGAFVPVSGFPEGFAEDLRRGSLVLHSPSLIGLDGSRALDLR